MLPGLLPALSPVAGFPLPGETGGSYLGCVSLLLVAFPMVTGTCLPPVLADIKPELSRRVDVVAVPGLASDFERKREATECRADREKA